MHWANRPNDELKDMWRKRLGCLSLWSCSRSVLSLAVALPGPAAVQAPPGTTAVLQLRRSCREQCYLPLAAGLPVSRHRLCRHTKHRAGRQGAGSWSLLAILFLKLLPIQECCSQKGGNLWLSKVFTGKLWAPFRSKASRLLQCCSVAGLQPPTAGTIHGTVRIRWWLMDFFHHRNFYTLPFCSLCHAISKTVSLSSLALLLPVLVKF